MQIKKANSLEEVKALENEWRTLAQKNLFLSPDWIIPWFESRPDSIPFVLSAVENGKLVGILPLCIEKHVLKFAAQQYGNHLDVLGENGGLAEKIIESDEWERIELGHLVDNSSIAKSLGEKAGRMEIVKSEGEGSNIVSLPKTMDAYFAGLEKKKRKNLRNDLSRLEREFKVETEVVGQKEFEGAWERFLKLHLENIEARNAKSVLGKKWFQEFYKKVAKRVLKQGKLFMMRLLLDGNEAGILLGIIFGKRMSVLNIGYDTKYLEKQSIGTVLFLKAIEYCVEKGIGTFDLLSGNSAYKKKFGAEEIDCEQLLVFRNKGAAVVHGLKQGIKARGKKILGR